MQTLQSAVDPRSKLNDHSKDVDANNFPFKLISRSYPTNYSTTKTDLFFFVFDLPHTRFHCNLHKKTWNPYTCRRHNYYALGHLEWAAQINPTRTIQTAASKPLSAREISHKWHEKLQAKPRSPDNEVYSRRKTLPGIFSALPGVAKAHIGAGSIRSLLQLLLPVVPPQLRVSVALHHFSLWMSGRLRGWGDSTLPLAAIHKSPAERGGERKKKRKREKGRTSAHTHARTHTKWATKTKERRWKGGEIRAPAGLRFYCQAMFKFKWFFLLLLFFVCMRFL